MKQIEAVRFDLLSFVVGVVVALIAGALIIQPISEENGRLRMACVSKDEQLVEWALRFSDLSAKVAEKTNNIATQTIK